MLIDLPDFASGILKALQRFDAERVDTSIIQPAEPFLDIAGEDLRRRIFMTQNESGESLCLRPEFTIPVCLRHIEIASGTPKRYAYLGQVFRQRRDGENEFYQAGIEDLGDENVAHADARAIVQATAIVADTMPGHPLKIVIGDQGVFEAVVAALGLASGWQKRLIHAFGQISQLENLLDHLAHPQKMAGLSEEVSQYLAKGDDAGLIAHIDAIMEKTGYSTHASRSPAEIVQRLGEKLALSETSLDSAKLAVLSEFLSIDVPLRQAPARLAAFALKTGLTLDHTVETFERRVMALIQQGADLSECSWRAAFGRPLDYYTGLVFEITQRDRSVVLAGGGRFDRMLTLLGAPNHIPAVGFALWLDRIHTARETA